jgi:hypothetical protein
LTWNDRKIWNEAVLKDLLNTVAFSKQNVRPVSVHLKKNASIIFQHDRECAFILILPHTGYLLHDHLVEQVDAVLASTMKRFRKCEAAEFGRKIGANEK